MKERLAKKRRGRAQELAKGSIKSQEEIDKILDREERNELEKLATTEADRAAELLASKKSDHDAKEQEAEILLIKANNDAEAEAAAKRKGDMFKKALAQPIFDEEVESANVQQMLTQQQEHAERFQVEVEQNLKHHHLGLSDRVKKRRQRRESKMQQKQYLLKERLQEKQTSDLREYHASMLSEGNKEEANLAAREEIKALSDALEDAKRDRETLREKISILAAQLDESEKSGNASAIEEIKDAEVQIKHLTNECESLELQNREFEALLRGKTKVIEDLEQQVVQLELSAKESSAADAEEMQSMIKDKELEIEDLSRDNDAKKKRIDELTQSNSAKETELDDLKKQTEEHAAEIERLKVLADRGADAEAAEAAAAAAEATRDEMFADLRKEQVIRKKLHNELEDMKGAIRVFARGRPLSGTENDKGCKNCIEYMNPTTLKIMDEFTRGKDGPDGKQFAFDSVFDPSSSQDDVFEDTKQLIESVLDGYNVCIFAYGQTGSGKTWTMTGIPEQPGITPRCISHLFDRVNQVGKFNTIRVSCYFVELYNDHLVDLLLNLKDKKAKPTKLDIKVDQRKQVYVKGAVELTVSSAEELQNLFDRANQNRHVSSTAMNSESSRSHSIFSVKVENLNRSTKKTTYGKLSLIDLAGSERAAKTKASPEQLREARSINQSLAALGNVIAALTEGEDFIPYRNNKLTMLMQDSLGGNAKTLMFVNFSPADYNAEETNGSLSYGTRVKNIKNNAVIGSDNRETAKLKAMVHNLEEQLNEMKSSKKGRGKGADGSDVSSFSESESSYSGSRSAAEPSRG